MIESNVREDCWASFGQNPTISTSNRAYVVIFVVFFLSEHEVHSIDFSKPMDNFPEVLNMLPVHLGWGEPTRTLVLWRQGFRHSTRNECLGWFAQIVLSLITLH